MAVLDKLAERPLWPHLRAAFVALHIIAVVVLAIPDAGGAALKRSAWQQPTVQNELDAWAKRLTAGGMAITKEELEERVWEVAKGWTAVTSALREPFTPYGTYLGVRERWRMFVAPHRWPSKLHIDIFENGEWRPIYVSRSDEYTYLARQFDESRFRAMMFRYTWDEYLGHYKHMARWVARHAARDFPQAEKVRLRLYRFRTPTPDEVLTDQIPKGKFRQKLVLDLEEFR